MKSLVATLGAFTLAALVSATTAHAQYRSFSTGDAGFYWGLDVGPTMAEDGHLTDFGGLKSSQDIDYDVGIRLNMAGGYAFNQNFATELELGWSLNTIDSIQGANTSDTWFSTVPILANVVLQYPIPRTVLVPYIGAGVGGAVTVFDTDGLFQPLPGGGGVVLHGSDSDFVFAWQAKAGLNFELNEMISLGIGYRFLWIDESSYSYEAAWFRGPDLSFGISKHLSHTVALTFQMRF
ncbi:MAG: porin family protein [Verrucomicrobiia bacterium]